jgi:hypothetical protein
VTRIRLQRVVARREEGRAQWPERAHNSNLPRFSSWRFSSRPPWPNPSTIRVAAWSLDNFRVIDLARPDDEIDHQLRSNKVVLWRCFSPTHTAGRNLLLRSSTVCHTASSRIRSLTGSASLIEHQVCYDLSLVTTRVVPRVNTKHTAPDLIVEPQTRCRRVRGSSAHLVSAAASLLNHYITPIEWRQGQSDLGSGKKLRFEGGRSETLWPRSELFRRYTRCLNFLAARVDLDLNLL